MEKILLAVGNREMEEYLKESLKDEVQFVGETVYREGVLRAIGQTGPSLVILRDALKGSTDLLSLVYSIRTSYPDIRILFIGVDRDSRDNFYANLVNYGIYDLVVGGRVNVMDILARIRVPAKHSDVKHFQPAPAVIETHVPVVNPPKQIIEILDEEEGDVVEVVNKTPTVAAKKEEKIVKKVEKAAQEPKPKINLKGLLKKKETGTSNDETSDEEIIERKEKPEKVKQRFAGIQSEVFSKDKIITFIGGRSGVGTTAIAINTAFALAEKNHSVLYMEINPKHPSASYWFDVGFDEFGIDTALTAIKEKKFGDISKAISRTSDLRNRETAMKSNYKKFPEGLDFLSYSKEYILQMYLREELAELKELYLYLMYQGGYDYIIVDLSFFADDRDIQGAIMYSNKVFTVINQDVSTIGYHISNINSLEHDGVSIKRKNNYVVNSYIKSKFTPKDIKEWLGTDSLILVPQSTVEVTESNAKGMPTVLNAKRSEFASAIQEIIKIIGGK